MTVTELIELLKNYEFNKSGKANTVYFRTNNEDSSWISDVSVYTYPNGDIKIGDMIIK